MVTNSNGRRNRAENASFVIASIQSMGIEPRPGSRLMQMHRILTDTVGTIRPGDPGFETAIEAERDMQLLGFIFDQSNPHRARPDFRFTAKRMLKDAVLPQDNPGGTPGRDFQFELFVAAICQSAGLLPVDYREPDVTCMVDGINYAIAAKRAKSLSSLEERVKDAAKQIEKTKLPGIITLDTCVALNRENQRIVVPIPDERFGPLYSSAMRAFLDRYAVKIRSWVYGKGVRGVVLHDHQIRLHPDGEWGLCSLTMALPTAHDDDRAEGEFSLFWSRYRNGLPNVEHLQAMQS